MLERLFALQMQGMILIYTGIYRDLSRQITVNIPMTLNFTAMVDSSGKEFRRLKGSGRVYEQPCQQCGSDFFPRKRNTQKYCSEACRAAAYRSRNTLPKSKIEGIENKQSELERSNDFNPLNIAAAATGALAANIIMGLFKNSDSDSEKAMSLLIDIHARELAFHQAMLSGKRKEFYLKRVQEIKKLHN
jgi:uncharacterized OB-fold protein